jgi:hypothetical protein
MQGLLQWRERTDQPFHETAHNEAGRRVRQHVGTHLATGLALGDQPADDGADGGAVLQPHFVDGLVAGLGNQCIGQARVAHGTAHKHRHGGMQPAVGIVAGGRNAFEHIHLALRDRRQHLGKQLGLGGEIAVTPPVARPAVAATRWPPVPRPSRLH